MNYVWYKYDFIWSKNTDGYTHVWYYWFCWNNFIVLHNYGLSTGIETRIAQKEAAKYSSETFQFVINH